VPPTNFLTRSPEGSAPYWIYLSPLPSLKSGMFPVQLGTCFFSKDNDLRELWRLVPSVPTKNKPEPKKQA